MVENLGLLDSRATGDLYRRCHVGLSLMFTRHPSYLPFELMASGCVVVTNENPATRWLLRGGENCVVAPTSASCIANAIVDILRSATRRERLAATALEDLERVCSPWPGEIERIHAFMRDPESFARSFE